MGPKSRCGLLNLMKNSIQPSSFSPVNYVIFLADLLLDELQESVSSPQQAKGRNQITSLPTIPASERQSPNKSVSSSTKVLSSSQFLALAEEALRQTTIARRLLESIADEPTAANLPSSPTSANARLSSNTIAGSQPPETLLTDNINSLAATESENSNPPTSVSEVKQREF